MQWSASDFGQARAGTYGQCGRPPPLATPRYVDHDAKYVMQVRCAVVALWSEQEAEYAPLIWLATAKLDSFLPTLSDLAQLAVTQPRPAPPGGRRRGIVAFLKE